MGIQRTLIGLANAAKSRKNCSLCVWDESENTLKEISHEQFMFIFANSFQNISLTECFSNKKPKSISGQFFKIIQKFTIKVIVKATFLKIFGKRKAFKSLLIKESRGKILKKLKTINHLAQNDCVLLADSHWNQLGLFQFIKRQFCSSKVFGFCYDIIPVERPDFVSKEFSSLFERYLQELALFSDQILCISIYSSIALKKYIVQNKLSCPKTQTIRAVRFGNSIELPDPNVSEKNSEDLFSILKRHSVKIDEYDESFASANEWFLWLGSLNSRKNPDVLLLALEELIGKRGLRTPVIFAGRPDTHSDYYLSKIRGNPLLKTKTLFLNSPSDDLLSEIWRGTKLFIFTSWEEGYGLPVAEALQMKVPVISSNSTSIPEVAGSLVEYFEPWDSRMLADLIFKFENDLEFKNECLKKAHLFKPSDWSDMLEDILRHDK